MEDFEENWRVFESLLSGREVPVAIGVIILVSFPGITVEIDNHLGVRSRAQILASHFP
jgi:hypothetical protein